MQLPQAVKERDQQRKRQHHREVTRHEHGVIHGDIAASGAIVEQVAEIFVHLLQQQQTQGRRKDEAKRLEPLAENVPVKRVQR